MKLPSLLAISPEGLESLQKANSIGGIAKYWELAKAFVKDVSPITTDFVASTDELTPTAAADFSATKKANGTSYNVRVISLSGPMMKTVGLWESLLYGATSTADIISELSAANADAEVDAIVLAIDSPGGTVDGTELLADAVRNSAKPVVAYVDGMAASAAYWVASQSAEIVAGGKTAMIGSIGTLYTHVSAQGYYTSQGIKVTNIVSDGSEDKARVSGTTDLTEDAINQIKSILNPINNEFKAAILAKRDVKSEAMTGKVYTAADAQALGLIDSIGTLQTAVKAAAKLANTKNSNYKKEKKEKMEEQLNALRAEFTAQVNELAAKFSVTAEELATVKADLQAKTEELNTLKARTPAAAPVAVATAQEPIAQTSEAIFNAYFGIK